MLDARHVAFSVISLFPPGQLDLPGSVKFAVTLILIFDILDVPDVGTMVLFLPQNLQSWNVILASSRYLLAITISPVWNADLDQGRCRTNLYYWLPGRLLSNGVPSNLAVWTWSVRTVAPFIGMLR